VAPPRSEPTRGSAEVHWVQPLSEIPSRIPRGLSLGDVAVHSGSVANRSPAPKSGSGEADSQVSSDADRLAGRGELAPDVFATQGLPSDSNNGEVRKIWRLIANASSAESKALAQRALADYYKKEGEDSLATLSARRAAYWEGRR
jgi:hypothetical protein